MFVIINTTLEIKDLGRPMTTALNEMSWKFVVKQHSDSKLTGCYPENFKNEDLRRKQ